MITLQQHQNMVQMIAALRNDQQIPDSGFDMNNVIKLSDEDVTRLSGTKALQDPDASPESCGTAGCVMGHAPMLFPEQIKWGRLIAGTFRLRYEDQWHEVHWYSAAQGLFGMSLTEVWEMLSTGGKPYAHLLDDAPNKRLVANTLEAWLNKQTVYEP